MFPKISQVPPTPPTSYVHPRVTASVPSQLKTIKASSRQCQAQLEKMRAPNWFPKFLPAKKAKWELMHLMDCVNPAHFTLHPWIISETKLWHTYVTIICTLPSCNANLLHRLRTVHHSSAIFSLRNFRMMLIKQVINFRKVKSENLKIRIDLWDGVTDGW